VLRHDANGLVTDATVFYPLGGGQPGDSGSAVLADGRRLRVVDTRRDKETREIVHLVEADGEFLAPGTELSLELDWERRYRHMRMHTCLHLLSAVIKAGVTGGNLNDQTGRLDFDLETADLRGSEIESMLAALVADDRAVRVSHISGPDLSARPELIRTMAVTPPLHLPDIRLVEIEGADLQPCGGTHLLRSGEIGAVRVAKIENKGRNNKRVVLALD
jgi:misacylated tRNA(Ala) deacylase